MRQSSVHEFGPVYAAPGLVFAYPRCGITTRQETLSVSILAHSPVYGHDWLVIGLWGSEPVSGDMPIRPVSPEWSDG